MVKNLFKGEHLAAELTRFRPQLASFFVVTEHICDLAELTILADNFLVRGRLMVIFFRLGNDLAADFAFEVGTRATDVMHAELRNVDHSLAGWALFLFLCLYHGLFFG